MNKPPITTHILNLETGKPAAEVEVTLYEPDSAAPLASAKTDSDGRVLQWDNAFMLLPFMLPMLISITMFRCY